MSERFRGLPGATRVLSGFYLILWYLSSNLPIKHPLAVANEPMRSRETRTNLCATSAQVNAVISQK